MILGVLSGLFKTLQTEHTGGAYSLGVRGCFKEILALFAADSREYSVRQWVGFAQQYMPIHPSTCCSAVLQGAQQTRVLRDSTLIDVLKIFHAHPYLNP